MVLQLPLAQLREAPANVRKAFDTGKLADLADSIRARGIIEPLVVRTLARGNGPTDTPIVYEIVAGARRFRAAGLAKLEAVPCVVRDTPADQVTQDQLVENLQREDISPLEEAQGYAALRRHLAVEQIAQQTGKGARYVYQRLQLLRLQTSALRALEAGKLSAGVAEVIGRFPPDQQQAFIRAYAWSANTLAGVTVAQARQWAEGRTVALSAAPWALEDGKLLPKAGPCSSCPKNSANEPGADQRTRPGCLDPACYHNKELRFLELRRAQLVKEGKRVQLLRGEQFTSGPTAKLPYLGDGAERRGPRCPASTLVGLVAGPPKLGAVVPLCGLKGCKVHTEGAGQRRGGQSAAARRETARQRAKIEATRRRNLQRLEWGRLVAAKAPSTTAKLGREDLRVIARALLEEEQHESRVAVCRMRGLEPAPGKRQTFDYFRAVARDITRATSTQQLLQLVYQLVLAPDVERSNYGEWAARRLEPLARRFRVRTPKLPQPKKAKKARRRS